jgi:hypothetical protein
MTGQPEEDAEPPSPNNGYGEPRTPRGPGAAKTTGPVRWVPVIAACAAVDVIAAAIGAYPTWQYGQRAALQGEMAALAAVLIAFVGLGSAVLAYFADKGAVKIAYVYVMMGVPRMAVAAGLAAAYWAICKPPALIFAGWLVVLYLLALVTESILMTRALKKSVSK